MSPSEDEAKRYEFGALSGHLRHRLPDGSCEAASLFSAYVLAADFDRLQSELSALKQALKDARPAIEAGVTVFERDADNRNDEKSPFTQWCRRCAVQLRGLLSLK